MRVAGVTAMAAGLLLIAACGTSTDSSNGNGNGNGPDNGPQPVTIESLGGEDWPVGEAGFDMEFPDPPDGWTEADIEHVAPTLIAWAQATALETDSFFSDDPEDVQLAALNDFTNQDLRDSVQGNRMATLIRANRFRDVEIIGEPRVTAVMEADELEFAGSPPYLAVFIQTRVAYPVRLDNGDETVIGVIRWHSLSTFGEGSGDQFGAAADWIAAGVDLCAAVYDDVMIALPLRQVEQLTFSRFVTAMDSAGSYDYQYTPDEQINTPEFEQRCAGDDKE